MKPFLFSVPEGNPIEIEPFHYAIVGQTQLSGKTTLLKSLATWAAEKGYKILIFDSKETEEDYAGFGQEIPVCMRETADALILRDLLESIFQSRLSRYFAQLSRLVEGSKGFDDIIKRAKEKEESTRSNFLKDAYRVLYDLLGRLKQEFKDVETVPTLQLVDGINRMVINKFSLEGQQLIVKNAFEDALKIYKRKVIIIIDEAFKFLPQSYSSAATRAVMQVITQGAKTGLFVWIATQFLAITNKDPLKACAVKFLGTQDHKTEVDHTIDLIPEIKGKFSRTEIMRLQLGHWILVSKKQVQMVYSLPMGIPEKMGRAVATGKKDPAEIRAILLKQYKKQQAEGDAVYKKKFKEMEKLHKKAVGLSNNLTIELNTTVLALKKLAKDNVSLEEKFENAEKSIRNLERQLAAKPAVTFPKQKKIDDLIHKTHPVIKATKQLQKINRIGTDTVDPIPQAATETDQPAKRFFLDLTHTELHTKIHYKDELVSMKTSTVMGKIVYVALKDLKDGFSESELSAELLEYGWNIGHNSLAPSLGNLVKQGLLIKTRAKNRSLTYRLPTKRSITVEGGVNNF